MNKGSIYKIALLLEQICSELKDIAEEQVDGKEIKKDKAKKPEITAEEKPDVTIEEIRKVLAEKSQEGLTSKVKELLEKYGANKLSAVKEKDYNELYYDAKLLK